MSGREESQFRTRSAIRAIGLAGVGLFAILVALSDVIALAPAGAAHLGPRSLAPCMAYAFGTDALGRDVMSETLHALTVTFSGTILAAAIAIAVGAIAGVAAVRAPAQTGLFLRGLVGVLGSVPVLVLAIVVAGISGHNLAPVAVGLAAAPSIFRTSFDRAARTLHSHHTEYARATGIPAHTLLRRDLVYEVRGNFLNVAGRTLASCAIVLSTLSFLGFGATPPHAGLGAMIAGARTNYLDLWWSALFPALALILLIVFARMVAALDAGEQP